MLFYFILNSEDIEDLLPPTMQPASQARNILLSAAILFSGATLGKILQMFAHMWVASISNRTFYYHQSQYLQPAVLSVWETKQQKILA